MIQTNKLCTAVVTTTSAEFAEKESIVLGDEGICKKNVYHGMTGMEK